MEKLNAENNEYEIEEAKATELDIYPDEVQSILEATRIKIIAMGYDPCKRCNP